MTHPALEELVARLREVQEAAREKKAGPEQLAVLRELVACCPAFAPAALELGRLLQQVDEPGVSSEQFTAEIQHALEQAVQGSNREASAVVELGYFHDTFRSSTSEAMALYEEAEARALETLEDAWAGMLRTLRHERTTEALQKALQVAARAEGLLPESGRIRLEVEEIRRWAKQERLNEPKGT